MFVPAASLAKTFVAPKPASRFSVAVKAASLGEPLASSLPSTKTCTSLLAASRVIATWCHALSSMLVVL